MFFERRLERGFQLRLALVTGEQQIPAGDERPRAVQPKVSCDPLEVAHLELASADIHRPQ